MPPVQYSVADPLDRATAYKREESSRQPLTLIGFHPANRYVLGVNSEHVPQVANQHVHDVAQSRRQIPNTCAVNPWQQEGNSEGNGQAAPAPGKDESSEGNDESEGEGKEESEARARRKAREFLSADQKPSLFNNTGHLGTYAEKGKQVGRAEENFAAMRQRHTISTVVDSSTTFSSTGDGDPPHVFVLFKGTKGGK